jgi:hypothetical protein
MNFFTSLAIFLWYGVSIAQTNKFTNQELKFIKTKKIDCQMRVNDLKNEVTLFSNPIIIPPVTDLDSGLVTRIEFVLKKENDKIYIDYLNFLQLVSKKNGTVINYDKIYAIAFDSKKENKEKSKILEFLVSKNEDEYSNIKASKLVELFDYPTNNSKVIRLVFFDTNISQLMNTATFEFNPEIFQGLIQSYNLLKLEYENYPIKHKFNLPVDSLQNGTYCNDIRLRIENNGDTTFIIGTLEDDITFWKLKMSTKYLYHIRMQNVDTVPERRGGLRIQLTNNNEILKETDAIYPEYLKDGKYRYSTQVFLTEEEFKLLLDNEIIYYWIYYKRTMYKSQDAIKFREKLNCLR